MHLLICTLYAARKCRKSNGSRCLLVFISCQETQQYPAEIVGRGQEKTLVFPLNFIVPCALFYPFAKGFDHIVFYPGRGEVARVLVSIMLVKYSMVCVGSLYYIRILDERKTATTFLFDFKVSYKL